MDAKVYCGDAKVGEGYVAKSKEEDEAVYAEAGAEGGIVVEGVVEEEDAVDLGGRGHSAL